jgi:ubiquinone/menaquinone biosynthesis C-methylase UbiE
VSFCPYDAAASSFDSYRALPQGVPEALRHAVLGVFDPKHPRLLDLGAGTGRIGRTFVAAGDDYVGIDLSLGMLREFTRQAETHKNDPVPRLAQADGERLPFRDATFDAVMLIQVIGAARNWRAVVAEARRVLRPAGALVVGHAVAPLEGIDARMKLRLASLLDEMGVPSYHMNTRGVVQPWLERLAQTSIRIVAAEWSAKRTPREFLDRQKTGARFSALPAPVKEEALRKLAAWATETFGSLDAEFSEQHSFELQVFKFQ